MVSLHQLFASAASGTNGTMASLASPPLFVAENQPALSLLGTLRASQHGAALVTDEFGTIRGMISMDDLAEEIVGALHPDDHQQQQALFRATGEDSWLVDGAMEIDAVIERLPELDNVVESEAEPFQTLAGFIVHRLDRLPVEGETFQAGPFEFDVIDMDRQRIDKVLIRRLPQPDPGEAREAG
jgi:putative hemolysin